MTDPPGRGHRYVWTQELDGEADKTSDEEGGWNIQGESSPGKSKTGAEKEKSRIRRSSQVH